MKTLRFFDDFESCEGMFQSAASVGNRDFFEWGRSVGLYHSSFFYEVEPVARENGHHALANWLEECHFDEQHECPACAGSGRVPEHMADGIRGGYA